METIKLSGETTWTVIHLLACGTNDSLYKYMLEKARVAVFFNDPPSTFDLNEEEYEYIHKLLVSTINMQFMNSDDCVKYLFKNNIVCDYNIHTHKESVNEALSEIEFKYRT